MCSSDLKTDEVEDIASLSANEQKTPRRRPTLGLVAQCLILYKIKSADYKYDTTTGMLAK